MANLLKSVCGRCAKASGGAVGADKSGKGFFDQFVATVKSVVFGVGHPAFTIVLVIVEVGASDPLGKALKLRGCLGLAQPVWGQKGILLRLTAFVRWCHALLPP